MRCLCNSVCGRRGCPLRLASLRVVGEGILFAATLALAEPLTTLARSARSCVSLVARCNGGYEDTLTALQSFATARRFATGVSPPPFLHGRAELRSARSRAFVSARGRSLAESPPRSLHLGRRRRDHSTGQSLPGKAGGGPRSRRYSERMEETRDRAERGSVVRGSDQASVAPKRTPRLDPIRDVQETR